jgi:hypothetical protein
MKRVIVVLAISLAPICVHADEHTGSLLQHMQEHLRTVNHFARHPIDATKQIIRDKYKQNLCDDAGASERNCPADMLDAMSDHPSNSDSDVRAKAKAIDDYSNNVREEGAEVLQTTVSPDPGTEPTGPYYYRDRFPDQN